MGFNLSGTRDSLLPPAGQSRVSALLHSHNCELRSLGLEKLLIARMSKSLRRLLELAAEKIGVRTRSSLTRQRNQSDAEWAAEVQAFMQEVGEGPEASLPDPGRSYPATSQSWKIEPFVKTASVPYKETFTSEEFEKLKRGLVPEAMEDKWFIYFENAELFLHRSWTGKGVFRARLKEEANGGATVIEAACAGQDPELDEEYKAELLRFVIGNLLLNRQLPYPKHPDEKERVPGMIQHSFSGTGYPEKTYRDE